MNEAPSSPPLALIIEDDPYQSDIFARAVEVAGYRSEVLSNGQEALDRLESGITPALVVLDLHLPGTAGDEILRHIRSDERLKEVPVILATADPRMADPLYEESDLVLLKPISFSQLSDLASRLRSRVSR